MTSLLYNGDSVQLLRMLDDEGITLPFLFADPPDNLGLAYDGMRDARPDYNKWLQSLFYAMLDSSSIAWLSYYHAYQPLIMSCVWDNISHHDTKCGLQWKSIIWRFTFGQHRDTDFGSGYRPILRLTKPSVDLSAYVSSIRVESERQRLGDPRASALGRVPDDVWDFPRVVGNATERRPWHPTQHPEALLTRILLSSGAGDPTSGVGLVTDAFAGTGSLLRVAERLGIPALGCEQSEYYCKMIAMGLRDCTITKDSSVVLDYVRSCI